MEQKLDPLKGLIDRCGGVLCKLATERVGLPWLKFVAMQAEQFQGPPIFSTLRLEGIHLHNLSRLLYGNPDLTLEQAKQAWERVKHALINGRSSHRVIAGVIPKLPLIKSGFSPAAAAVQLLAALEWSFPGRFQATRTGASFISPDVKFSLSDCTPRIRIGPSLIKQDFDVSPAVIVHMPLGKPVSAAPWTTGLRHALIKALPDLVSQIDFVFSAAVFAGKDYERTLVAKFRPSTDPREKQSNEVRLIAMSEVDPVPALWAMYQDRVDLDVFCWLFGKPHREYKTYGERKRRKHVAAALKLDRWIDEAAGQKVTINRVKRTEEDEEEEQPKLETEYLSLYGVIG